MAERITLLDINLNVGGASDALKELEQASIGLMQRKAELKNSMADLNKAFKEGAITEQQYLETMAKLNTETLSNNKAISDNTAQTKANIQIVQSQAQSIDQMRAKLATVSKEWSKLTEDEILNTQKGKELNAEKLRLTENLKRLEAATGDTRRNVGNYTDSILQAANSTKAATGGVSGLTAGMAGSITGIKAFNATLAANPIGAIVTAAMLLIGWIEKMATKSSEGGNKMRSAFAPIITIFERITDVVGKFFQIWLAGVSFVINTAIKVANAIGLVSDETMRMAEASQRLAKEERDLYNEETNRIVQLQRLKTAQEEQKAILADQTKSAAERKKAGEEALRLMKEEEDINVSLAKRKYELIKAQNELSDSTDEDLRKEQEALAELEKVRTDAASKRKEVAGQVSGFEKQLRDKALSESKAASDARAKAYEEAQQRKTKAAEERYNKEMKRLNDIMQAELLRQREIRATSEVNSEYDEQLFQNLQSKKLDILSRQLEEQKITIDDYNLATQEMEVERLERIAEINEAARAKEMEAKLMNLQNEQELREMDITNQFELRELQLESQMAQEIAAAEKIGADTAIIERKYAKIREQISKDEANAKLAVAGELAGQLSKLLGESTVAGKIAAISQATINTYLGATKALSQGGFLGIAQAAVVISAGLAQVAKIVSTKVEKPQIEQPRTRYERGGKMALFGGKRHSEGGTILRGSDGSVLEVEKGEAAFVLNRSATRAISQLSAINVAHGGNDFGRTGLSYFANGGQIMLSGSSYGMSDKDMEKMAYYIASAVASLPAPVVSVSDINSAQEKNIRIIQSNVL